MESPPIARYIPHKSKKRVFPGASSSCMDPEVIEISPPVNRTTNTNSLKQKGVIHHEIIDVDMDDEGDVLLIDRKVDINNKGKEALANMSFGPSTEAKLGSVDGAQSSKKSCAPGSQNSVNLDGSGSDVQNEEYDYMDVYFDDFMYEDEYTILQSHFDNIDIPPGVEAPIPWLPGLAQDESKPATISSPTANLQMKLQLNSAGFHPGAGPSHSMWLPAPAQVREKSMSKGRTSLQTQMDSASPLDKVEPPSFWSSTVSAKSKKTSALLSSSTYSSSQTQRDAMNVPSGLKPFKVSRQSVSLHSKRKPAVSGGTSYYSSHDQLGGVKLSGGVEPFISAPYFANSTKKQAGNCNYYSNFRMPMEIVNPPGVDASMSNWKSAPAYSGFIDPFDDAHSFPEEEAYAPWGPNPAKSQRSATDVGSSTIPSSSMEQCGYDDIMKKFQLFKKFDTVEDHSDHHYVRNGSSSVRPSKNWAKKIQEEWKILEKDLPDTIFVRVYESRMDLLRAVIVGAEGTPYHDGLFFFDMYFPSSYPSVPPLVYYHSGGLRINPNLYNCGKVCLSLLNTWSGGQKEKWIPGVSTMLQVLVSIQGLILNAKPYFNEPGYANMSGSPSGEKSSLHYNESTFILSLKTMIYTMRRPPKYFEDFVAGHFCKHAHDILVACKAYIEGAQVGCLVKGGVQDVDEGDKSCSEGFKDNVAASIQTLVNAFQQVGAKETEKFLPLARTGRKPLTPVPPMTASYYQYPVSNFANYYHW